MTKSGGHDGVWTTIQNAPNDDLNAANLKNVGKTTIKNALTNLSNENRIGTFKTTRNGPTKWLGVVGGRLNQEQDMLD